MDAKAEVLAAKINYEICQALTPEWARQESAADTILKQLFKHVLGETDAASQTQDGIE